MLQHPKIVLVGGWCMVLFSILFVGITIIINALAITQPYLYNLSQQALFEVQQGTPAIRFLLIVYAISPLLLVPGAVGSYYLFIEKHEANMRVGMYFATIGITALTISLLMIPSLNWIVTSSIPSLAVDLRPPFIFLLQGLHNYLGIYVGDILGLGCILVWFFIASFVIIRDDALPRPVGTVQLLIAFLTLFVLLLRTSGVLPEVYNNIQVAGLLSLWLFIYGISVISLHKD